MSRSNLLSVRLPFRSDLSLGRGVPPHLQLRLRGHPMAGGRVQGVTDYKDGKEREQYVVGLRNSQGIRCIPEATKYTKEFVMAKT